MTERNTKPDADQPATPDPQSADGDISPCYQAYLERNNHRPDSCTIYSAVTAGTIEETWIKAYGSAFVSRDEMR
ncbi:hypothetical protein GS429_16235 [Natronorubrum sp. JWXQ-INN-674]|uniref:DUF7511 domain-containing protein n=1 Tax=Natronorubrum halalkaliphilum TaxID=2691917 RepID=A0A6B0VR84_9EURY|nr:hypothetical protein [Natronorubrum halalkaliphilum]MXV63577.1 hypothetical protein [Natronorubrum halalkaliphilum]